MFAGIRAAGDRPEHFTQGEYTEPLHDVAVFYGYTKTLRKVMADYIKAGRKAVYIDLGYWRREGLTGYHKISVNDRHPTAYFQKRKHNAYRANSISVSVKPWHNGSHIIIAGMGDKAAEAEGFQVEAWERRAIEALRMVTDRRIIYRPKPSWLRAQPIPGADYSPPSQPLDHILKSAHAIVTHHSNVAVEALVEGVPAFCWKGVAVPLASQDLKLIETPVRSDARQQWVNDIAFTQWNINEMRLGLPWACLKEEGLIP